jgi:hypothetical protein
MTKQQKAITASILTNMHEHATLPIATPAEKAAAELAVGAFFFAMRSCEYTQVSGPRRTKPLRIRNIRFFRHNRAMDLLDPELPSATALSITFEFQKTDIQHETVHQHATPLQILCPVKAWANIVQRILSYPGCDTESLVSTVITNNQRRCISSTFLAGQLQAAAKRIGPDVLGFSHLEVGTHSIRSGGAMAMYLAGVPVFTIMLIGRWSSDAFLRYIRRQVLQFSAGVSTRMVSPQAQNFFTLPEFDAEHPRTREHRTKLHSPQHIGPRKKISTPDQAIVPRFDLTT